MIFLPHVNRMNYAILFRRFHRTNISTLGGFARNTANNYGEVQRDEPVNIDLPKKVKVVVAGGGVVGCSVAYHLAKDFNVTDVIMTDRGVVGGGSTHFGAGLLGQLKNTQVERDICRDSMKLYKELQDQGLETGWNQCGSLHLARTKERMHALRRLASVAKSAGIECELISPIEAQKKAPVITTDRLEGALWCPTDGTADAFELCNTLSSEARRLGVTIAEKCRISEIITQDKAIKGVVLENGAAIECEYFVNAAGYYGHVLGKLSNPVVKVPLYPCEHYFLHSLPVVGIDENMPAIHDHDGRFYIRVKNGRYIGGGFMEKSKPIKFQDLPMELRGLLPEDWDQFCDLLGEMIFRIPSLGDTKVDRLYNSPESFPPDFKWLVGEAPEVRNYFIASGMKSIGVEAAGGVGKLTAEWICRGEPQRDIWDIDIRRFIALHNNEQFLRDRVTEVPGRYYSMPYVVNEYKTGRQLRMSPIYPRLCEAGAVFGQTMGYERPHYYDLEYKDTFGKRIDSTNTFFKPSWFERVEQEYTATRERVGLIDYSSFTKLEVSSPGDEAVRLLQYLCSNNVDIPVGHIVNTGMQNSWGGYENDCSLVRLRHNKFMIICPTKQQMRAQTWIRRHIQKDQPVFVTDVTSMYTAICVIGPNSRPLMQELTEQPMGIKDFPYFTCKTLDVGMANGVRMLNMTHTGEMGWVLYIPNEYALHVYDRLKAVGANYGVENVGYYAQRSLRIEKFFALWGQDLSTTTTPFECGRSFRVKLDKDDFVGKEALLRKKEEGLKKRYIQLVLHEHNVEQDPWPWGGEPIYLDDTCVGLVTSSAYGYTLGFQICLGYIQCLDNHGIPQIVSNDYVLKNEFTVEIAGERFAAKANLHSPAQAYLGITSERTYYATR